MHKILYFLVLVLSLMVTSCYVRLGKSKFKKRCEDISCKGKDIRKNENAIHPKRLKREYYAVTKKGDTVQVDYDEKDFDNTMKRSLLGYDTLIPLKTYKGTPFTGKSIFLFKDDTRLNPLPGCYKTIATYKNGLPLFTNTYYPNGLLKRRVKGIHRGITGSLDIKYDYNGRILKYNCNQPGLHFSLERNQEATEYNKMGFMGFRMRLIDTTKAYSETFVIERDVRNERHTSNETYEYELISGDSERIIYKNIMDSTGIIEQTQFSVEFFDYFDYWAGRPRSFTYPRSLYDPDTVLRLHLEYLDYGGIKILGQYFMNERHGIWNYYNEDGSLKDVELYEGGRKQYILHDENAFIYFHVLYDAENGEVSQYKNDWLPDFNPDSTFVYDFNQFEWTRHESTEYNSLRTYSLNPQVYSNGYVYKLDSLIKSFYRKDYYSNGRTKAIGFVTENEEKTGIWVNFSPKGDTVTINDKYYGKDNGLYRKYINGELVEKRDEIPKARKNDPNFYRTIDKFIRDPVTRRVYWFRTKTW